MIGVLNSGGEVGSTMDSDLYVQINNEPNALTLIRLKNLPVELSLGICLLLLQHLDLLDVLLLLNDPSGLGGLSGRGHADAGGGLGLAGGVDGPI